MTIALDHALILTGFKAFTLLALAFIITSVFLRNRGSAALHSLVWTATIVSLCLLPLLSQTMPPLHLGVIPADADSTEAATPLPVIKDLAPAQDMTATAQPRSVAKFSKPLGSPSAPLAPTQSGPSQGPGFDVAIPMIWATGFLLSLLATTLGWLSLARLRRQGVTCPDGPLREDVSRMSDALGIKRPIEIILTDQRDVPMTWGFLRPTLLLPRSATDWNAEERQTVLLHELAHIGRSDSAVQCLGQFATALYWYNPLVWISVKQLRAAQERACDDTVLRHGTCATTYAAHLTQIVSGRATAPWERSTALAAGRPGRLEQRVRDILALHRNRQGATSRAIIASSAIALTATLLFGALTPFAPLLHAATKTTTPSSQHNQLEDLAQLQAALVDKSLHPVDAAALQRTAIEAMLESLNDPHAAYLSAKTLEDMRIHMEGELFGIGAHLQLVNEHLVVVRSIPGSPAIEAGLKANDVITAVDDRPAKGESLTTLVDWIRGPLDTQISLMIDRNGKSQKLDVKRGRIKLPTVHGLRGVTSDGSQQPALIGRQVDIGYFHITAVNHRTPTELNKKIQSLISQGMKSAILDLRNCPGGSLEPATQIADLFLSRGNLVQIESRDGSRKIITASATTHWQFPLVILVNQATASAAEIVAGALQDHNRAIVIGTRTLGKASVQSLVHINPTLGAVKLTTAKYFPPSGRNINREPNRDTWGISANDGYFVSLQETTKSHVHNRLNEIVDKDTEPLELATLTASVISSSLKDNQLAKSIEALETHQRTGTFPKIGGSQSDLQAYVQSETLRSQQAELLNKLNAIQSAVTDLVDEAP